MNAKAMLRAQYHFFYLTVKMNLDGMDAAAAVRQPAPEGNCANWIVGHLIDVHNSVMGLVEADPVWTDPSLERLDGPVTGAGDALDWAAMTAALLDSEGRMLAALDALDEERLDDGGFSDPFGNEVTRGALLNLLAVHQNYHAGQLGLSRRLVGLPGAIRAPEPAAA